MTNETQHTPGPWKTHFSGEAHRSEWGDWQSPVYAVPTGLTICKATGKTVEEAEANARLIAAAPELLEVLKRLTKFEASHDPSWKDAFTQANNIIAKLNNENEQKTS